MASCAKCHRHRLCNPHDGADPNPGADLVNWQVANPVSFLGQLDELAVLQPRAQSHNAGRKLARRPAPNSQSPDSHRRQPAGYLYADIANYNDLAETDEEGIHRLLVEAIRVMMSNVAKNEGRIAHLGGDAILAEFRQADRALRCAIDVQLAAGQWNSGRAVDQRVLFRIGIGFAGSPGDGVDVGEKVAELAARLEKLASSGGICVVQAAGLNPGDSLLVPAAATDPQLAGDVYHPLPAFWIDIDSGQSIDSTLTAAVKVSTGFHE